MLTGGTATKWRYSIDFASHHLYQAVPYWGHWGEHPTTRRWEYLSNKDFPLVGTRKYDLVLSNEGDPRYLAPNRWLWDSLCLRLRNWSLANALRLRLVTEFGCLERALPPPTAALAGERWDRYGKRVPSYTHFGCWAALVLGHAGTPFKWNDAAMFGEMRWRTSGGRTSPVWERSIYPVDNFAELKRIKSFVGNIDLGQVYPREGEATSPGHGWARRPQLSPVGLERRCVDDRALVAL